MPGGKDTLENRKNIRTSYSPGIYSQRNSEFSNKDGLSKEQRYKERGDRMKMFGILSTAINQSVKSDRKLEIKSFEDLKNLDRKQRVVVYKLIEEDRKSILNEASFEEKKTIIEEISKADLNPRQKLNLSSMVLTLEEKQKWIKELLVDKDQDKNEIKNKIMSFFKVYELVNSIPPYTRTDKKTPYFLAKKANIKDYKRSSEQNELIRQWILNIMLNLKELNNSGADVLDDTHTAWLNEKVVTLSPKVLAIKDALSSLSTIEKTKINSFNRDQFDSFIDELDVFGKRNVETITKSFGEGVDKKAQDILGLNLAMIDLFPKINNYNKLVKRELANDKNFVSKYDQFLEELDKAPETRIQKILLEKQFLANYIKEDKSLDETKKQSLLKESSNLDQEIYETYKEYNSIDELKQVRGAEYYAEVEQNYISQQQVETQKYQNTESGKEFNKVGQKLMGEKQFLQLFDQNQITSEKLKGDLSDEEYKNLLIENKQEGNPENQQKLQKQREYVLLDTTNNEIKNRFVNRITYFFSNILDVQIDEGGKENILENLKIDQNQIENNQITIQGKYQNQNLTFTYDTITGELFTGKRLHIDDHSQNVSVNNKMVRLENVSGPTFGEHIKQSNSISYSDILKKSEGNQESYAEELNKQLTIKCPLPNQSDDFKEEMKLQSLQNIVSQEVFGMMGVSDKLFLNKSIDGSDNRYEVFPLLARTISSYNKSELNKFRENIKYMSDFYIKTNQLENTENIVSRKLTGLMSKVFPRYRSTKNYVQRIFLDREKNQQKSNYSGKQFHSFFSSFLTGGERLSSDGKNIIDINKFTMFYEDLSQTKKQTESITGDYFTLLNENMDKYYAEDLLDNQNVDNSQTIV